MKNPLNLLLAAALLLISGCKDDEPANAVLLGAWENTSLLVTECTDPANNYTQDCQDNCEIIFFTETTVISLGETFPYTVSENNLNIYENSYTISVLQYSIENTVLTLTFKADSADGSCKFASKYVKIP
jgi:hypothetical protein